MTELVVVSKAIWSIPGRWFKERVLWIAITIRK
jgi:hypothetical protein